MAERARSGEGAEPGVEPLKRRWIRQFGISNQVWTIVGAEAEDRSSRPAVNDLRKQGHGERSARLKRHDAERLPSV